MGLFLHVLSGGRRDFSAIGGMRANRYEVLVDEAVADEAEHLLDEIQPSETRREETPRGTATIPSES